MVKYIDLTRGAVACVDDADYAKLIQMGKWSLCSKGYVVHWYKDEKGKRRAAHMHRIILNAPPHLVVDHIDNNPRNNRRSNLRLATRSENNANRRTFKSNTVGYTGVNRNRGQYEARVKYYGKRIYLGRFPDPEYAAMVYDIAIQILYKDFARPNFPDRDTTPEIEAYVMEKLARYNLPAD